MSELGFTSPREMAAALFIIGGLIFFIGSGIGMLRLPDFYSRIHASGNSETLGCMLTFIGLMIYEGATLTSLKIAFVFLLVFLILITCAVIFCKDILSAAIIYSAFSFCAVLLYLMMGSPDVAFTEAVIGTISTIFFVASLKKIDRWCK